MEARIRQALTEKYDLPVRAQLRNVDRGLGRGQDEFVYSVTGQAARASLSPWMPGRRGTFPFLKLPPELRNRIYDLVLTLPPSGLSLDRCSGCSQVTARLLERPGEDMSCVSRWTDPRQSKGRYALTGHTNAFLALLSANRQVFSEAMPLAYSCNTFHLKESGMWIVALDMPRERFNHLRRLSFNFSPTEELLTAWKGAFGILARKPGGFEELIIHAKDRQWPDLADHAFRALASLINKAERVRWVGSCPVLQDQVAKALRKIEARPRRLEPLKVEEERIRTALKGWEETKHRVLSGCSCT